MVERLGYVQIDTIAVVQRAHEHVLWSRRPDYEPQMLHQLQAVDRRVFEYWTHAASYVPMTDYRFYAPGMRRFADGERMQSWRRDNGKLTRHVLRRIREEGALAASDFEAPPGKRGPWWDWKPAKRALEYLFWAGELTISERRGFQRLYDLTERVLPEWVDTTEPSPEEQAQFSVRRTLGNYGVADVPHVRYWLRDEGAVAAALVDLIDAGEVTPVRVRGWEGGRSTHSRPLSRPRPAGNAAGGASTSCLPSTTW
ncbi:MAG: crosslink repair DNA glycosylase YcaQ family protein [Gemmatimonadota bacterium]